MIELKMRMVSSFVNIDVELDNGVKFDAGLHDTAELLHLAREFEYWATELREYAERIKQNTYKEVGSEKNRHKNAD